MPVIARYRNPVIDTDFPDPSILAAPVDGWWWAHSTQHTTIERWAHVPVARSRDLVSWETVGDALPEKPAWGRDQWECAWAPHVVAAEGRYLMYYASMRDSRAGMCIGIAVADHPAGPFVDTAEPLVCGEGYVAIDAMRLDDPAVLVGVGPVVAHVPQAPLLKVSAGLDPRAQLAGQKPGYVLVDLDPWDPLSAVSLDGDRADFAVSSSPSAMLVRCHPRYM